MRAHALLRAMFTAAAILGSTALHAREAEPVPSPGMTAGAQEPVTTLADALLRAYRHNPELDAQRAQLRATGEQLVQARSAYGPTLTVQGRYGYARDRIEQADGTYFRGRGFTATADAVVNQPLFTFGRLRAGRELARSQVDFDRERLRFTETQTLQSTISAYVDVLLDTELLSIARRNLDILERQLNAGRARFKTREITLTDFEQVNSQHALARARVETALGSLGASESRFVRVVGAVPGALAPLPPLSGLPLSLEEACLAAEQANPLLRAARARERASWMQVEQRRAETRPSLSLEGQANYGAASPYDNDQTQFITRGQVVLDIPVFSSGLLTSRVREARELNQADWHLSDQAARDARSDVTVNWNLMTSSRASVAALELAAEAAREALRGGEIQQRAGDRNTQDMLDLARELLNAEASLANARANEYSAQTGLLAAIGALEAAQLLPQSPD